LREQFVDALYNELRFGPSQYDLASDSALGNSSRPVWRGIAYSSFRFPHLRKATICGCSVLACVVVQFTLRTLEATSSLVDSDTAIDVLACRIRRSVVRRYGDFDRWCHNWPLRSPKYLFYLNKFLTYGGG